MVRDARRVALDHIEAVVSGNPVAMAADYAPKAVLERAGSVYQDREAIEAYFETVPFRLGSARVVFDDLTVVDDTATFFWHLEGSEMPASGSDVCTVKNGSIVHQMVHLDTSDF